ncbi:MULTISPECIES: anaerobic ribonucleoside-triphosphate reductase [Halomonadaceae]|uniref:anaerobic ribonucleoside-triphosphate reductase n=1 Tax=Halomonadaceae TaxID=28256 RepID=UPI00159A8314|nr:MULTISPECIES: anaerobic ribonucleoside-triphosphate reductase [Halomonas]QJQ94859.1 oxidoreductase [Halomonas sp. PA5]
MPHSQRNSLPSEQRQRCEVWTRVMGYHRPVSQFNLGKRAEHHERRHFSEAAASL